MKWSLLVVPVAIAVDIVASDNILLVLIFSVLALIPLAAMMAESTEQLAAHVGPAVGGLLNATFGNLAELIIMISLLSKGLHEVVLAGIFGGIVANALLATGLSMFVGGLKYHVQTYNRENTRDLASLLAIAIFGLLVISVIGISIGPDHAEDSFISPIVSLFLLAGYVLYLVYSMITHKDLFGSDEEESEIKWSPWRSITILAVITAVVVWVSETLSGVIAHAVVDARVSELFIGAVLVAVIGAAAEISSAMRASRKDRMDLSYSISMGGSVQIALFVAPLLVLLSHVVGSRPLQLIFDYESIMVLFFSVVITMQLARDGQSTWFKGALLVLVYLIIATGILMIPT
jgi:Ca2+:H+ antiporter